MLRGFLRTLDENPREKKYSLKAQGVVVKTFEDVFEVHWLKGSNTAMMSEIQNDWGIIIAKNVMDGRFSTQKLESFDFTPSPESVKYIEIHEDAMGIWFKRHFRIELIIFERDSETVGYEIKFLDDPKP